MKFLTALLKHRYINIRVYVTRRSLRQSKHRPLLERSEQHFYGTPSGRPTAPSRVLYLVNLGFANMTIIRDLSTPGWHQSNNAEIF
jgi:hypothetical protein